MDGDSFSCHCSSGFIGNPPNCKPECILNSECPYNRSCIDKRCKDPCANDICGEDATCHVKNHTPICECPVNYSGDPFVVCSIIDNDNDTDVDATTTISPDVNECQMSTDCPYDKSCVDYKCSDPCINGCGVYSECTPTFHVAYCDCKVGYTGDPNTGCYEIPEQGMVFCSIR